MNKRIFPFLLIAIALTVGVLSCKKKVDTVVNRADIYFPLEIGRYVTYQVDSTIYTNFDCAMGVRTSKCQMQYTIADTFRDNQERLSYRIEVRKRPADTAQWAPFKIVYATLNPASIEVVESNYRFIKMVFPVKNGITWKGNTYIPEGDADNMNYTDWDYLYSRMGESYYNGLATFDNTVTVDHRNEGVNYNDIDSSSNIYADRTYSQEVYGYNIGMIFREVTRWERQPGSCREGYTTTMRAIDHN
jgi:hypothetical protein